MNLEADDAFGILWTMQLLQSCSGDGWSTGLTCVSHTEHLHLYPATGHKMVLSHPPETDWYAVMVTATYWTFTSC